MPVAHLQPDVLSAEEWEQLKGTKAFRSLLNEPGTPGDEFVSLTGP